MGKLKTVGSELFLGSSNHSPEVQAFGCITAISGLGGPANQIDVSCWRNEDGEYEQGRKQPGTVTISGIYESEDDTFDTVADLYETGDTVAFAIGGSDGEGIVPVVRSGDVF